MTDKYDKVRKTPEPKSIWDDDVDYEKVMKLPGQERHDLFPNDFDPLGNPYGDF
jgi:hypothetical protein